MHLRELYRNKGNKTTLLVKDIFRAKFVLITRDILPMKARDFFDVIIFIGTDEATFADIIICPERSIEKCDYFHQNKKVLTANEGKIYCINTAALGKLVKTKTNLEFPSLVYEDTLNVNDVGLEMARLGKAEKIYCTFDSGSETIFLNLEQLDDYMSEVQKEKYISRLKNTRCASRKDFSQTVNWWIG